MRNANLLRRIAILGLGVATVYIYLPTYSTSSRAFVSGVESFALAESIVNHHSFSDPFEALPTGPSAHMGPLFPVYLALIIRVFGQGSAAVGVIMWVASLTLAVQLMMLPLLAKHLGLGFWTGMLAALAWLAAAIPPTLFFEAQLVGLLVVATAFLMATSFTSEMTTRQLLLSGTLWGALLLLQPVVILVLPFWLLLLHFQSLSSLRQKLALGILPIIFVTPWVVRNFVVFHKPVFIRDNLGLELAVSNNDCASYSFEINDATGCFSKLHPNKSYEEALKVRQLGEVEYNRVRLQEVIRWIKDNPSAFASLSLKRFEAFWVPPISDDPGPGVIMRPWVLDCLTLLGVAGLFLMWRNARVAAFVVALWLIFFPLIYYFIQFFQRYRFPIVWASLLPGCYFIVALAEGIWGKRETQGGHVPTRVSNSEAG